MTTITDFPSLRPKRPAIKSPGDQLAEIGSVPLQRSICLQTIGLAYSKLKTLVADDGAEARRMIEAECDLIDNPHTGCCNE